MQSPNNPEQVPIAKILLDHWGYTAFRPKQEEIIRAVLNGQDTLALLPTGGGKSLCFQVPALALGKLCLVVSPLIALMKDQVSRLKNAGIQARAITSELSYAEIDNALESAALGKLDFLYVSPERLKSDLFLERLHRMPLGLIAIDEAHCISQWGYDFRPSYLNINAIRARVPNVPVLALTASATSTVAKDIMEKLAFKTPHMVRGSFLRPELVLWLSFGQDKFGRLLKILKKIDGTSIVYTRTRKGTVRLAQFLSQHGISAKAYNAGLNAKVRELIQQEWTCGELSCVVATNAFGMGIDKSDVRAVVHMELPPDPESYYQEAGRGGRDGKQAYAFLLVGPGDEDVLRDRTMAGFPDLSDIRKVYQAFANSNSIALSSGELESYDLDLEALAKRTALTTSTVHYSLKALELDGKVILSESAHSPSRVFIRAAHKDVYNMRVTDDVKGPLLEALLRLYGGLYEESAVISETRIGKEIGKDDRTVRNMLLELDRQKMIAYKPANDKPKLTLLTPRLDAARLNLDPAALETRKQRAIKRMEAMFDYIGNDEICRSKALLAYFDEPQENDCGKCDVCVAHRNYNAPHDGTITVEDPLETYVSKTATRWKKDQ